MPEITKETKDMNEEVVTKKETKSNKEKTKKDNSNTSKSATSSKKDSNSSNVKKTKKTQKSKVVDEKNISIKSKTNSEKTKKTNQENANKKVSKSSNASKTDEVKIPQKANKKIEDKKSDNKKEEKIKEENVIQKIKNFIAKIVAMQEEARKEAEEKSKKEVELTQSTENKNESVKQAVPYMLEYYDLPYRYNETVVKILAQTPKRLFVYWDISDTDKQKYLKAFGERFFEDTYPVLLVHNEEKNYTFEVAINDFANSWYLDINDPKSKYVIELGRKFKSKPEIVNITVTDETNDIVIKNDYIPITISNTLEVPNNRILFESIQEKVLYRNIKNNEETFVNIENKMFTGNDKDKHTIYDIYKEIYQDEIKDENMLDLLNPSSMSSSTFK